MSKRYIESAKLVDKTKAYDATEAMKLVVDTAKAKFDESIELHVRLGVDGRNADQQVRGVVVLPEGTGRSVKVLVIAKGDKAEEAKAAGADVVGDDDIVKKPVCPICKAALRCENKLLHSKGQRYTIHYNCKKHGDMLLSLKLHRNFNETWRARRTVKLADETALKEYREGLEKANIKRKTSRRRKSKSRRPAQQEN